MASQFVVTTFTTLFDAFAGSAATVPVPSVVYQAFKGKVCPMVLLSKLSITKSAFALLSNKKHKEKKKNVYNN